MKRVFKILPIVGLLALTPMVNAQERVAEMLQGDLNSQDNLSDFRVLSKAYLEPFGKSFGTSLNNGWYNSAAPHKLFGFDITFNTAVVLPASGDREYDVSKLDLKYWELSDPANSMAQSVTGDKTSGPTLTDKATGLASMPLPQGANLRFVSAPIVQIGVGLPFHTEVIGRFFPKVDMGSMGKFSLWGVGVKNEFKEFIPGFKKVPIDISILLGYTKFKSTFEVANNQNLNFEATGFTGRLLISKSIPVLTVYAGAGYNKSTTNVALKGTYTVGAVSLTDPLDLEFKNTGFIANVGLRIKLALIAFHFDYAFSDYGVFNAGVGINFR